MTPIFSHSSHWLSVELVGQAPNRDAIGAVVRVTVGGRTLVQPRLSAGSYLSQHDHRLHFGLGSHDRIDGLAVIWPDGSPQTGQKPSVDGREVICQQAR